MILLSGCRDDSFVTFENKDLTCDEYLSDYFIFIDDTYEIDLSRLNNIYIYKDKIYMSVPQGGEIVAYNFNTEEFTTIGETGTGPFEFLTTSITVAGNTMYIYDLSLSKIVSYDLEQEKFISEQVLDDSYSGILMHADSSSIFLYTINRVSNDGYEQRVVSFRDDFQMIDTVFTSVSNNFIRHFEDGRDFAGQFQLFSNKIPTFIGEELYLFDNTSFRYSKNNKLDDDYAEVNFSYNPDYEFYIETMRERYSTSSNLSVYFFNQALKNETRAFEALFSEVLTSETHLLFSLFATDKKAFLIKDLKNQDLKILCADLNYQPVRMKESRIYWVAHNDSYEYQLIKTEI
ncbi:MAG: 6-bladed beta-propeller [Balneolaceae bacterium]|nr:6-bladed beta-propeller [Balneolaceae bacterium]